MKKAGRSWKSSLTGSAVYSTDSVEHICEEQRAPNELCLAAVPASSGIFLAEGRRNGKAGLRPRAGFGLTGAICRFLSIGILMAALSGCAAHPSSVRHPSARDIGGDTPASENNGGYPGDSGERDAAAGNGLTGDGPGAPGTAPFPSKGTAAPDAPAPGSVEVSTKVEQRKDPRVAASNSFTGLGKRMLEKGNADGAIRMLERAVGINPNDGPGYYYLAEAWIMKKNPKLAEQFNRIARVHLDHDTTWRQRSDEQYRRINAMLAGQG